MTFQSKGVQAASAATGALSGETMGHVGQAAAAGMVVPPALDPDISPLNVAKIMAYTRRWPVCSRPPARSKFVCGGKRFVGHHL